MRILVVSDSHGNIVRLKHVIGYANAQKLDAIIHCGDWDNPGAVLIMKDLSARLDSAKRAGKAGAEIPVYGVLGNADVDSQMVASLRNTNVNFSVDFLKLGLGGRSIGVCHFPGKLGTAIRSQEYDVLFHGHTHKKKDKLFGRTKVVNPGALQKTLVPSFAVYDTEKNSMEFVDIAI